MSKVNRRRPTYKLKPPYRFGIPRSLKANARFQRLVEEASAERDAPTTTSSPLGIAPVIQGNDDDEVLWTEEESTARHRDSAREDRK